KWALCNTYVLAGQEDKANELLAELKASEITPRTAFGLLMIHVTLGDLDEAFRWLEFQPPDTWVPWIRTWPDFESLRQDPRFDDFLKDHNLPSV
ncbi:MAG: hypothetical protein OEQ53_11265, partial [Saprospiraceae bacterium]|nr:hypothetical protein [Saprospiraceae bacterium]